MSKIAELDIDLIRSASQAAATVLWEMMESLKPALTSLELDEIAGAIMEREGVRSAPRLEGFPGNTCISINETVAHGVPNHRRIRCGDLVNIDVSVEMEGHYGDVAYTFVVGGYADKMTERLCETARRATLLAVENSVAGAKVNEIAKLIEKEARANEFTVIRNLCSHGVGRSLHAYPANILNYYDPADDTVLEEGMVIAWEPYISSCASRVIEKKGCDHSLTTHNNSLVAQFEHTVLITADKPEILTLLPR